jgi:hypothetical protein
MPSGSGSRGARIHTDRSEHGSASILELVLVGIVVALGRG